MTSEQARKHIVRVLREKFGTGAQPLDPVIQSEPIKVPVSALQEPFMEDEDMQPFIGEQMPMLGQPGAAAQPMEQLLLGPADPAPTPNRGPNAADPTMQVSPMAAREQEQPLDVPFSVPME